MPAKPYLDKIELALKRGTLSPLDPYNDPNWRRSEQARIVFAAVIAFAVAFLVAALQTSAAQKRDAQLTVARIQCLAYQAETLRVSSQDVASKDEKSSSINGIFQIRKLSNSCIALIKKIIGRDNVDSINATKLSLSYQAYSVAVEQSMKLRGEGNSNESDKIDADEVAPQFVEVTNAVRDLDKSYNDQAALSTATANVGSVIVLLIGAIIMGLIAQRSNKSGRQVIVSSMEAQKAILRQSEERLQALISCTRDVVAIVDQSGAISYLSPNGVESWANHIDTEGSPNFASVIHEDDLSRFQDLLDTVVLGEGWVDRSQAAVSDEMRLLEANGEYHDYEVLLVNRTTTPSIEGIVVTCSDITERKSLVDRLSHQAFHDTLTGLPNRAQFVRRLDRAVARANRENSVIGLLAIDLDNFKVINDSLGHQIGDQLLGVIAERLQSSLRDDDLVARLGGDEFVILLEGIASDTVAMQAAERIHKHISSPVMIGEREIVLNVSIGVTINVGGNEEPQDLMRDVDTALYRAKQAGKGQYLVFDEAMKREAIERLELESDLRAALESNSLSVAYQPIIDLRTGAIVEVESLCRWVHPDRGFVSPGVFIPIAEEAGLISDLGSWILRESCSQLREWQDADPLFCNLGMSVNISGKQMSNPDLILGIQAILDDTEIDPSRIKLEITESEMMKDVSATIQRLRDLRQIGVKLAVDDFGTGYSSMCYLSDFPINTLKVDQTFVQRLGSSKEDNAIVEAILTLGKNLKLSITSEGIETEAQLKSLQLFGCDYGQGYLFSRPLAADKLAEFVADPEILTKLFKMRKQKAALLKVA